MKEHRSLQLFQTGRDSGFAEILLRKNVCGNLAELRRDIDVLKAKHHRAIGILDLTGRRAEFDLRIGRLVS